MFRTVFCDRSFAPRLSRYIGAIVFIIAEVIVIVSSTGSSSGPDRTTWVLSAIYCLFFLFCLLFNVCVRVGDDNVLRLSVFWIPFYKVRLDEIKEINRVIDPQERKLPKFSFGIYLSGESGWCLTSGMPLVQIVTKKKTMFVTCKKLTELLEIVARQTNRDPAATSKEVDITQVM